MLAGPYGIVCSTLRTSMSARKLAHLQELWCLVHNKSTQRALCLLPHGTAEVHHRANRARVLLRI
jgi:hypothetical protein